MKKTITLLLAATGVAMGANTEPISISKDSHAFSMEELNLTIPDGKPITVVMELDWVTLSHLTEENYIFKISGATPRPTGGGSFGMSVTLNANKNVLGTITGPNDIFTQNNSLKITPSVSNVTFATLVFTASDYNTTKSDIDMYLYLWEAGKDEPFGYENGGNATTYIDTYDGINFNENLVKSAIVYNEILDATATKNEAIKMYNASIPEPTTATLSLLALAGLAARRRRR